MIVKYLGREPYLEAQAAMQEFVENASNSTKSEVWFVEHPQVYTQGVSCDLTTFESSDIPIVKSDRGGQITYHGPGQVVMYLLLNIKQLGLGVKQLVTILEDVMINVLANYSIVAERISGAPGVYVEGAKIGALGLRFRNGFSYHGLSLNIDMDLHPFDNIDPCGYQDMAVTQVKDLLLNNPVFEQRLPAIKQIQDALLNELQHQLSASL